MTYRRMVLGFFFPTNSVLCRGKREGNSTYTLGIRQFSPKNGKCENAYLHEEAANDKNGGKPWSRGHFAVCVADAILCKFIHFIMRDKFSFSLFNVCL